MDNIYLKEIKPGVNVDVYDICNAYSIVSVPLCHALKKILMPGQRGEKKYKQDLEEAIKSISRALEQHMDLIASAQKETNQHGFKGENK
jgi:hypothetical protein